MLHSNVLAKFWNHFFIGVGKTRKVAAFWIAIARVTRSLPHTPMALTVDCSTVTADSTFTRVTTHTKARRVAGSSANSVEVWVTA